MTTVKKRMRNLFAAIGVVGGGFWGVYYTANTNPQTITTPTGPRRVHVTNTDGFEVFSDVFLGVIPPTEANDIDISGRVDGFDLIRLARAFGTTFGDPRYDIDSDLDGNGAIDGIDLTRLANNFGRIFTP